MLDEFDSNSRYLLFVFISSNDCLVCQSEIEVYNRISNEISSYNVEVIGILNDENDFDKFGTVDFQLKNNPDIYLKYSTGNTPESILYDKKIGEIVYRTTRKKTLSSQMATFEIVNLIVRNS